MSAASGRARKEKTSLDFLKDEREVEFEDNPVFVHCIHLDFDGKIMGPISHLFTIQKYDGEREITSLPVFPLQHAKEVGLREKLIERGKMFFKVISVKHMHYTGLTLKTSDDIDSQVVIDFEEAINRHPQWKPPIKSVFEEFAHNELSFSDKPELQSFMESQRSMQKKCIEECCASESKHFDEYVGDLEKEDYIVSQMNRTAPQRLPITVVPHDLCDFVENNTLTDDEYLIMSYRVFGFVLRSRKWHELDMANVFEVATLGAGEGFDELVLPPGHGDMVKSMIRQHLRDKKFSSIHCDKMDVVRGKGRGLIILLHGVPGVGKTSTAECVADLFRRPLFQITSGDLGITAKEVEDALEESFSLASRWNSILLIDEADVFLAERTKEDFVRNSLVAVFLRMMEYYAGVLFLTTNRVGVFDEAFTSRIHITCLYYPPLDQSSTLQIFQKNWDRIIARYKEGGRVININILEITAFAIEYFQNNKEGRWNGRQIRNAFQSALALAELDALGEGDFLGESDHNRPVVLGRKNFDTVADAYKGFTSYLKQVYGADFARRARENLWRFDAFGAPRMPNSLSTRLRIAEPAMPPPPAPSGQWQGQPHHGYDPRYQQPYYPPQQQHAESYDHRGQRPPYPSTSRPYPYPDPKERRDPGAGAGSLDQ
ncbi:P-loop containing nucleoside triphosphate hydrolase protein [Xylaria cubensis]|nr:P-loop containing nucleoside triphosphate hydrolase protein [Xylaria cubensis]